MTSRRAVVLPLAALAAAACSHAAPPLTASGSRTAPPPTAPFESMAPSPSTQAQHRAQHTWCSYLEALYHRATLDGSAWRQLDRCNHETSSASPEMMERTVTCSRRALDAFSGDPFSEAYASEVKRCGVEVIDALALAPPEVAPFVATLCERAASCGTRDALGGCRADLTERLGKRLGRALGALNEQSRSAFQRCLRTAECRDTGDQVSTCLEPLLDRLLWTPD